MSEPIEILHASDNECGPCGGRSNVIAFECDGGRFAWAECLGCASGWMDEEQKRAGEQVLRAEGRAA